MGWRFGCQPPNVSLVDLVIELEQEATVQDVNQALKEASNRYLDYTDELLSLSKKSKWPIPIIFAPLKINNLRATENRKMPRFRVFRQTRYISSVFRLPKMFRYGFYILNRVASFLPVSAP